MTLQHRLKGVTNNAKNYFIDTRYSSDGGYTWSVPRSVFQGLHWEARPMQVPHDANGDGNNDIYIFLTQVIVPTTLPADQANATTSNGVGVAWIASYDNGKTWTNPSTERFAAKIIHRNYAEPSGVSADYKSAGGMAAPFMIGRDRVAFVAEEINKVESPYIVATDPGDWDWNGAAFTGPWTSVDYDGTNDANVYPHSDTNAWVVSPGTFGAGPFAATLSDGRILMAAGSDRLIAVWVGDETGHNFIAQPIPFSVPAGIWPFIMPISDTQIIVAAGSGTSSKHFVNVRLGTIKTAKLIPVGVYKGFKNGQLFIQTESSTRAEAFAQCQAAIAANQTSRFRCVWNDKVIFDTGMIYENPDIPATVTFVQNKVTPVVYGTASGTVTVSFSVRNSNGDKVYSSGIIPVVSGKWSNQITTKLANGTYSVFVSASTSEVARRDFAISIGSIVATNTPNKNVFGCGRTLLDSYAAGSLGCYGIEDIQGAFGGISFACGGTGSSTIGCVIATKACTSGTAKATAFYTGIQLSATKLIVVSTHLETSPDAVRAGITGLWEYTCVPQTNPTTPRATVAPTAGGAVLGAATNVYADIMRMLLSIQNAITTLQ